MICINRQAGHLLTYRTNEYAKIGSHGVVQEIGMYSIMENPMTACGCFECIVMLIPEANGVMVVNREDTSMTPAGMTFKPTTAIGTTNRLISIRYNGKAQLAVCRCFSSLDK